MLDGWWRVDRPSTPRCSLPEDTSYPLLLCQALVPLPSFNPFVLRIEGRHGARAQAEAQEGDFAAQELIGFNAWSAAMSLAIKLRRMSVLPPGPPEPAPAARPGSSGAAAAQGAQGAQGGAVGSAAAQARWASIYLPCISPRSPLHLTYTSPISPLHLPYISRTSPPGAMGVEQGGGTRQPLTPGAGGARPQR